MLIVIDTGPLTHFAQAELLDTLRSLLEPYDACIYPREVFEELKNGALGEYPSNNTVLGCEWLSLHEINDPRISDATIYFKEKLGGPGERNLGEAACMAIAAADDEVVYLDDSEGCLLAEQHGLQVTTTVDLLLDAVDENRLRRQDARGVVEALLATGYRLPSWALAAFD